jgi:enoyl-CoA hydratase/long-chain 3-hydroxyacyl-CoA dehydrogenase|tara:strand:- start:444 stop:758 length:315 start_codon:yes stop_codon:yes gene_type:complete
MPLLEVISHEKTAKEVTSAAVDVGIRQGKTVIAVKDVPGFYVNRCLGPFLVEALALLQQGVGAEQVNKALLSFGFPVGGVVSADHSSSPHCTPVPQHKLTSTHS